MDARPALVEIGRHLRALDFDVVLIGNAAAALQGAPVTTVDLDFMFRRTPGNVAKIKKLARALDAVVLRPYYPVSDLFRVVRDDDGLQLDFMATIHGVRSYAGLRDRGTDVAIDDVVLRVASLDDIIKSKRAAGRPRDRAVLDVLERTREKAPKPKGPSRRRQGRE